MTTEILIGDCIEMMRGLADGSIHCCVTFPPYFGLRDCYIDDKARSIESFLEATE